ncbi:MAG: TldD/PmbA family protein [Firmicutes bacterium]|nr:TldD/PmbA family protein [Bacillota bacterium]
MIDRDGLTAVLAVASKWGSDYADVFIEEAHTAQIFCEQDRIERVTAGVDAGAGIRVIVGETTAYAYTNDLSLDALKEAAEVAAAAARGQAGFTGINLCRRYPTFELPIMIRPETVAVADKVSIVEQANQAARKADRRVKQVTVSYRDISQKVIIANSMGGWVEDERIRTNLALNVIAMEDDRIQTGFESRGGIIGFELFEQEDPMEMAVKAADRAVRMLQARPAPAGRMPVVIAGEAGGTMIHEACGHGLEADLVQKGISVYAGKLGQQVASPLISVVDDATLPGKFGSYRFDDEGTEGQRTVLIENGILKGYLYDYLTAQKDQVTSTGNGRRESYQHKPIPRMTNTFVLPGKDDAKTIIGDTDRGLLVTRMGGGQVNTANGDFVFEVSDGYLISGGQIGEPVRGATLTGNGPKALTLVDRVGGDLGFAIGLCGKDGQGAPVSDAQPTIRIPELVVGGIMEEDQ